MKGWSIIFYLVCLDAWNFDCSHSCGILWATYVEVEANRFVVGLLNVGVGGIFVVDAKYDVWAGGNLVFYFCDDGEVVDADGGGWLLSPSPDDIVFGVSPMIVDISKSSGSLAPFCVSWKKYLLGSTDTNSSMILKILGSCDTFSISWSVIPCSTSCKV